MKIALLALLLAFPISVSAGQSESLWLGADRSFNLLSKPTFPIVDESAIMRGKLYLWAYQAGAIEKKMDILAGGLGNVGASVEYYTGTAENRAQLILLLKSLVDESGELFDPADKLDRETRPIAETMTPDPRANFGAESLKNQALSLRKSCAGAQAAANALAASLARDEELAFGASLLAAGIDALGHMLDKLVNNSETIFMKSR